MLTAKQEVELIECLISEAKEQLACYLKHAKPTLGDGVLERTISRLNVLYEVKDALAERGKPGVRLH